MPAPAAKAGAAQPPATHRLPASARPPGVMKKIYLHTVPIAVCITLATYLDRSNLALAAPVMTRELGLTSSQYGLASGAMFITYGLFMLPSALGFSTVGLRPWFAAIMCAWGVCTAAQAAATGFASLVTVRLLLGATEAGCLPGCWCFLARFVPAADMPYAYSWVILATVAAQVVGAPLAAVFLGPMNGVAGLRGWHWLFIVEGCATVLFGASLLFFITESPATAAWLSDDDRAWLAAEHAADAAAGVAPAEVGAEAGQGAGPDAPKGGRDSPLHILKDALKVVRTWQVWVLGAACALIQTAYNGVVYFTPLLIGSEFGQSTRTYESPMAEARHSAVTALRSSAVYVPASAAVVLAGWVSVRTGDRKWQVLVVLLASAVGYAGLPAVLAAAGPGAALGMLVLACVGGVSALAALCTWPGEYVKHDAHPAASYGFWNAFAAIGGFAGPYMLGALPLDKACWVLTSFQALAAVVLFGFGVHEDRATRARAATLETGLGAAAPAPEAMPQSWGASLMRSLSSSLVIVDGSLGLPRGTLR